MKKKKYDEQDGVWRTVGGRRVFIKSGQDLASAMKESGKFKKISDVSRKEYRKVKTEQDEYKINEESKQIKRNYRDISDKRAKEGQRAYAENRSKEMKNQNDYEKFYKNKELYKDYDNPKESKVDLSELKGKHIVGKEDKFYTRKDGTKEYDPYKGTLYEKKYDSVEEALNDPNHPTRKYIDEKLNWREQVKRNNELMEKELKDYEKDNSRYYDDDNYYEIFRNNERRNAKIKQEVPTEPYEYVEAYAGYHDKSYKLAGTKMSGKDVVEYGRKSWTGKEYTNDEFMEHLTDSNWHQERKMLEEAKLTNQELAYIKDRTTLSQWSVGEELTGSKNVEKMIKEAKSYYSNNSSNLMNRYSGTVDYLKNTTNMSGAEILELLKKIDEDKK